VVFLDPRLASSERHSSTVSLLFRFHPEPGRPEICS